MHAIEVTWVNSIITSLQFQWTAWFASLSRTAVLLTTCLCPLRHLTLWPECIFWRTEVSQSIHNLLNPQYQVCVYNQ